MEFFATLWRQATLGLFLTLFLGRALHAAPQASAGVWLDVPFVEQSQDGCGSAAISMILQYWNAHGMQIGAPRVGAAAIQRRLYSRKARGIFSSDMQSYLKASGFLVFALAGSWIDLEENLKQGRPLIVSIQPGSASAQHASARMRRTRTDRLRRIGRLLSPRGGSLRLDCPVRGTTRA